MSHLGWMCSFWQCVVLCLLIALGSDSGWPLHLEQMKFGYWLGFFVDLTEWTLNKNPDMFFCKFYDFIILILTNNGSQKTYAGEREENAPVRQVFPVSFVSFHIIFLLFLCVLALFHSSSIPFLFNFSVSCLWCFPPYLIFPVCPPPFWFEEHLSSTNAFVLLDLYRHRWLVKHQDTALMPALLCLPTNSSSETLGLLPREPSAPSSTGPCAASRIPW